MLRQAFFRLSQQPQLRDLATGNPLARRMAGRFVAGESLSDALRCVRELNGRGMSVSLDHLGENVGSRAEAMEARDTSCRMLQEIGRADVESNISLKLTQLGLDLDPDLAFENTLAVVAEAAQIDNFVRIDMESSEYVDRTLDLFYRLFQRHHNVGVVIQAYLYRSASDLEHLIEVGARVRLVKGAYLEPPSVAYQNKRRVDESFVRLMETLLERGTYPAIATHDVAMIEATKDVARRRNIDISRFEFQMLYGIRRDLQVGLVRQGYNVRVYVPFGIHWYPYLMRRMAERPANLMFVMGSIAREAAGARR